MGLDKCNTQRYLTSDTCGYMFLTMKTDTLSERLKIAMERANLNQAQLAEDSGVAQPSIFKILSGATKRSSFIVDIAIALGVRPEWLALNIGPMTEAGASEFDSPPTPPRTEGAVFINLWDGERRLPEFVAAPIELKGKSCRAYRIGVDTGFHEATRGTIAIIDVNERPEINDYVYAIVQGQPSIYKFLPSASGGLIATADSRVPLIPVGDMAKIVGVVVYLSKITKP